MQCVGQWVQTALVSGLVSGLCRSYKGWQIDHESRRLSTLCHVWHEFAEDATQYDALTKIIYGGANIFNPSANRKLRSGMLSETSWNCEKTAWGLWLNHCQGQWYLTVVWGPCQAMTTTEVQCTLRPPSLRPEKKRKIVLKFQPFSTRILPNFRVKHAMLSLLSLLSLFSLECLGAQFGLKRTCSWVGTPSETNLKSMCEACGCEGDTGPWNSHCHVEC